MALVSASRPQQLVVSFTAIALFFDPVFKKKILLLGKKYGNTAAFVIPYVVIAILVMYYNYIKIWFADRLRCQSTITLQLMI